MKLKIKQPIKTIWNISKEISGFPATTIIEKTIEAAPRSPDHDVNRHCLILHLNGISNANTAIGLAIKVSIATMQSEGMAISGNLCGNASNPSKKKIKIWARPVIPSKMELVYLYF